MDTDRKITQDDLNAAQRGLNMIAMSLAELRELMMKHEHGRLFADRVIARAARQMLHAKHRMGARD